MSYQKVKGTQDFYNENSLKMRYIEEKVRSIISNYGFSEVITPIFENTEVFVRSAGDSSDIVTKEMYTFLDKSERSITLRPEGTAAIVRCFVENKLHSTPGIKKYFYFGPMFRYERPQAGRYRQFNQFGVEVYGDSSPYLDTEIILSAYKVFSNLGIKNIKLKINTIGDFKSREDYANALREYFANHLDSLCSDCKKRYEKNPMRILDCKVDKDNEVLLNAPRIKDFLTEESKEYFNNVLKSLDNLEIPYEVDNNLVRGLDYYTDTVFEFIIDGDNEFKGLAICAGGRYADLIKGFGGPDIPGVGYAFGVERVMNIMTVENLFPTLAKEVDVLIISLDNDSKISALKLADKLRDNDLYVELDYKNNNLKPQFKLADRVKPKYIIIIGEEERNSGIYTVKNTVTKTEDKIEVNNIINAIKENI